MKTYRLVFCFVTFVVMGSRVFAQGKSEKPEHGHSPLERIAYLEELGDLNVISMFSRSLNAFVEGPEIFTDSVETSIIQPPDLIRIEFKDSSVIGHADFENPVHCLLVEVDDENQHYGIYSLWGEKATLEMPLPSDESSVTWKGVSCEAALIREIVKLGLTEERARAIVDDHRDYWFAPGLRAFLLKKDSIIESDLSTIYLFEKVSKQ